MSSQARLTLWPRSNDYLLNSAVVLRGSSWGNSRTSSPLAVLGLATNAFAVNVADVYQAAVENDPVLGAAKQDYAAREEVVPQTRAGLLPNISLNGSTRVRSARVSQRPDSSKPIPRARLRATARRRLVMSYNTHSWQAQLVQPILDVAAYYTYKSAQAMKAQASRTTPPSEQNLIVRAVRRIPRCTAQPGRARLDQRRRSRGETPAGTGAATLRRRPRRNYGCVGRDRRLRQRRGAPHPGRADQGIQFETLSTLTGESYEQVDQISADLPIVNPASIDENEWVYDRARQQSDRARVARSADRRATRPARASSRTSADDRCGRELQRRRQSRSATGRRSGSSATRPIRASMGCSCRCRSTRGASPVESARSARATAPIGELLRNNEWTVSRDIRNLLRAVTTDVIRVQARIKSIKSAESALEATQTGYEVGTRNIVDVLQAQQRLYLSQFDYADSRYNYVRDLMLLRRPPERSTPPTSRR